MSRTTTLRGFLMGAPLAFAALLLQHPMGGADFYETVAGNVTPWLAVHYGGAVLFPLMGYVVWLLIRDVPGRAARIARIALPVYAVFYGVWEAVFGIATGVVAQQGNELGGARRDGVSEAVNAFLTHPVIGESGLFAMIGGLAWIVAITAAVMALRRVGVSLAAQVLLGAGALMAVHIPPIGPIALVCLSLCTLLVERHRESRATQVAWATA
jgi:hypothetical protein